MLFYVMCVVPFLHSSASSEDASLARPIFLKGLGFSGCKGFGFMNLGPRVEGLGAYGLRFRWVWA